MLTNREIATVAWVVIPLIWLIVKDPGIRSGATGVLKSFLAPKLFLKALLSFGVLALAIAWPMSIAELQQTQTSKTFAFWVVGVGLPMLLGLNDIQRLGRFWRQEIFKKLDLSVFMGFVFSLYVFSLWAELVLVPIVALVAALRQATLSQQNEGSGDIGRALEWLTIGVSTMMVLYVIGRILEEPGSLLSKENLSIFMLATSLTVVYSPIVFCLGIYMRYESMFVQMRISWPSVVIGKKVQWRCIKKCALSPKRIQGLEGLLAKEGTTMGNKMELMDAIDGF